MPIRVPIILANQEWTAATGGAPATIWSTGRVTTKGARVEVEFTDNGFLDLEEMEFSTTGDTKTYIFRTSGNYTGATQTTTTPDPPGISSEVEIGATAAVTLENLLNAILTIDSSDVNAWIDGTTLFIEDAVGTDSTSTITYLDGTSATVTITASYGESTPSSVANGSEGAQEYNGHSWNVLVDGVAEAITFGASQFDYTDGIVALRTEIASQAASFALVDLPENTSSDRFAFEHPTSAVDSTLEINGYVGTPALFAEGEFKRGVTIGHPTNDTPANDARYIRMYHPADPVFFRNDNRPLIDLADNDQILYNEFVFLRDGYNPNDGENLLSTDPRLHFKAPAGYTFKSDVTFEGDILLLGGAVLEQQTTILMVADRTITLNSGETGAGVSGDGRAGIIVDRGTSTDTKFIYDENESVAGGESGVWNFEGVNKPTLVGAIRSTQSITIGDGVNTFGTFNADSDGNLVTALTNTLTQLPNGGEVKILRGDYVVPADFSTGSASGIRITGEGWGTNIHTLASQLSIAGGGATAQGVTIDNVKLRTANETNAVFAITAGTGTLVVGDAIEAQSGTAYEGTIIDIFVAADGTQWLVTEPSVGTVPDNGVVVRTPIGGPTTADGTVVNGTQAVAAQPDSSCLLMGSAGATLTDVIITQCFFSNPTQITTTPATAAGKDIELVGTATTLERIIAPANISTTDLQEII